MKNISEKRVGPSPTENILKMKKSLLLHLKTTEFRSKSFTDIDIDKCVNRLIYGTRIIKLTKNGYGKSHPVIFFILDNDFNKLQWISKHKQYRDSRIDLRSVSSISEIPTAVNKKKLSKYNQSLLLSIHHGLHSELVLCFESEELKKEWWCGLQYFIERAHVEHEAVPQTSNELAKEIFARADRNGSNTLDKAEIRQIFRELQIYVKGKKIVDIMERYDYNKNGKIEFDEFKVLVKELLRKDELVPLFKKYCPGWISSNLTHPAMTLEGFQKFFKEEQYQNLNFNQLRTFHKSFEGIEPKAPAISFDLFCDLVFSMMNTIFKVHHSLKYQDMRRPLTDYYINSSHNTYLMTNQLTGESSVRAYVNAIVKGCRCVEIDLWNGPNAEPIIYHGHTMTSKISFKDVIVALKEHAFQRNPYPMILSFENHCDLRAQQKIVDILKSEIGDMIYTIPEDAHEIDFYPSPESLENKFIIKGKGILIDKTQQLEQDSPSSPKQINIEVSGNCVGTEFDQQTNPVKSEYVDHYSIVSEGDSSFDSPDQVSNPQKSIFFGEASSPLKKIDTKSTVDEEASFPRNKQKNTDPSSRRNLYPNSNPVGCKPPQRSNSINTTFIALNKNYDDWIITEDSFEDDDDNKVSNRVDGLPQASFFSTRPKFRSSTLSARNPRPQSSKPSQTSDKFFTGPQQSSLSIQLPKKKEDHKVKILPELNDLISMVGCKMSFDDSRSVWEISSSDENKIAKLYKKEPKSLIDFNKKYLTRIYPAGSRIDSSNFDPILSWATGSQMVALNVQTHDEAMLINYAKFSSNGRTGYVLKPPYLRSDALGDKHQPYPHEMKTPMKLLTVRIISGQQIRPDNYKSKEIIDPYVEVKIKGLEVDETNNFSFRTQTIKDNGFHPVWDVKGATNVFKFYISAPDFCFLVFNVYDEDLVTREKMGWYAIEFNHIQQGYRVVPILNNLFLPIKHSYIFCHILIEDLICVA